MKTILLSDHREVLLAYQDEYRQSKGGDRHAVVTKIIEEITSQDKGKGKEAVKGLESVSQLFYQLINPSNSEISSTSTQKIQNWYKNHKNVPLEDELTLVPVGTVWNYRLVIQPVQGSHC